MPCSPYKEVPSDCTVITKHDFTECRVYKRRWFTLGVFVLYSMTNAFQWIEYSIIANIVMKFYDVPSTYVDWTSMIYMILYIPFIFPASWLIDKLVSGNTFLIISS